VFVTAYEAHAIDAFERGAIDYLLKPVDPARLALTVERLRQRLQSPPLDVDTLKALLARISHKDDPAPERLRWIQASVGNQLRIIAIDEVLFFQSTDKYTRVAIAGGEALIRRPLKEILEQVDPEQFWQIHRSTIVNMRAVANVSRDLAGRLSVSLKGHSEQLEVSRGFAHLFKSL
jgi:DNA-binding LytR/AlgR family response regulator